MSQPVNGSSPVIMVLPASVDVGERSVWDKQVVQPRIKEGISSALSTQEASHAEASLAESSGCFIDCLFAVANFIKNIFRYLFCDEPFNTSNANEVPQVHKQEPPLTVPLLAASLPQVVTQPKAVAPVEIPAPIPPVVVAAIPNEVAPLLPAPIPAALAVVPSLPIPPPSSSLAPPHEQESDLPLAKEAEPVKPEVVQFHRSISGGAKAPTPPVPHSQRLPPLSPEGETQLQPIVEDERESDEDESDAQLSQIVGVASAASVHVLAPAPQRAHPSPSFPPPASSVGQHNMSMRSDASAFKTKEVEKTVDIPAIRKTVLARLLANEKAVVICLSYQKTPIELFVAIDVVIIQACAELCLEMIGKYPQVVENNTDAAIELLTDALDSYSERTKDISVSDQYTIYKVTKHLNVQTYGATRMLSYFKHAAQRGLFDEAKYSRLMSWLSDEAKHAKNLTWNHWNGPLIAPPESLTQNQPALSMVVAGPPASPLSPAGQKTPESVFVVPKTIEELMQKYVKDIVGKNTTMPFETKWLYKLQAGIEILQDYERLAGLEVVLSIVLNEISFEPGAPLDESAMLNYLKVVVQVFEKMKAIFEKEKGVRFIGDSITRHFSNEGWNNDYAKPYPALAAYLKQLKT